MADTPRNPFPVVSESTVIRTKIGTLITIASALVIGAVGGALWARDMSHAVNDLGKRLARIEIALGLDTWRYIPPQASNK